MPAHKVIYKWNYLFRLDYCTITKVFSFIFDRAQKRMEGEYVLGSKISVRYFNKERGNIIAKNLGMLICGIPLKSRKTLFDCLL